MRAIITNAVSLHVSGTKHYNLTFCLLRTMVLNLIPSAGQLCNILKAIEL
jgi:hypothetical protein